MVGRVAVGALVGKCLELELGLRRFTVGVRVGKS